jgi:DNA-binding transcriptional MerR regulator
MAWYSENIEGDLTVSMFCPRQNVNRLNILKKINTTTCMKRHQPMTNEMLSIAAVERDTGLPKDTLRVWERRYGFPVPLRNANDERVYPADQVEKLRLMRRLLDHGFRPGKIVQKSLQELTTLAKELGRQRSHNGSDNQHSAEIVDLVDLLRNHQVDAMQRFMSDLLHKLGLEQFVLHVAAPTCTSVGDSWASGELRVFEEHLFSEQLALLLRNAISTEKETREHQAATEN